MGSHIWTLDPPLALVWGSYRTFRTLAEGKYVNEVGLWGFTSCSLLSASSVWMRIWSGSFLILLPQLPCVLGLFTCRDTSVRQGCYWCDDQSKSWKKGFVWLTRPRHSSWSKEVRAGSKIGQDLEAMKECYLLFIACLVYWYNPGPWAQG